MPYRYLEDIATADVAFEAWGRSLNELIQAAGDATVNVMVEDLQSIVPTCTKRIEVAEENLELLLFQLLGELIYYKDAEGLLLRYTDLSVQEEEGAVRAQAVAAGEAIDPQRHRLVVDVKAVTFHRLNVARREDLWWATVVLDV